MISENEALLVRLFGLVHSLHAAPGGDARLALRIQEELLPASAELDRIIGDLQADREREGWPWFVGTVTGDEGPEQLEEPDEREVLRSVYREIGAELVEDDDGSGLRATHTDSGMVSHISPFMLGRLGAEFMSLRWFVDYIMDGFAGVLDHAGSSAD